MVVEGYTDVMAMHLAGVTTAVASCGTAFGDEHISVLRRYLLDDRRGASAGEVVYTFDGDAAGQKAALKAFDSDQRFAANTYVAIEQDGMDPCELRQAQGVTRRCGNWSTPRVACSSSRSVRGRPVQPGLGRGRGTPPSTRPSASRVRTAR